MVLNRLPNHLRVSVMLKHRFIRVIIVIAIFALSLILVDRILTTIPALCGDLVITSTSTTHQADVERLPDGSILDEYTNIEITDNSETIYGVLEQYDWMIVFGALLLTFLICIITAWQYAVACRARIKACRANIDTDRQANANLLAKAKHRVELDTVRTSETLKQSAYAGGSQHAPRCIIENNSTIPIQEATSQLLRQIEHCEEQLINDKMRCNAMVKEYNAIIHAFPLRLFAKPFRLTEQPYYGVLDSPDDVISDWALEQ